VTQKTENEIVARTAAEWRGYSRARRLSIAVRSLRALHRDGWGEQFALAADVVTEEMQRCWGEQRSGALDVPIPYALTPEAINAAMCRGERMR